MPRPHSFQKQIYLCHLQTRQNDQVEMNLQYHLYKSKIIKDPKQTLGEPHILRDMNQIQFSEKLLFVLGLKDNFLVSLTYFCTSVSFAGTPNRSSSPTALTVVLQPYFDSIPEGSCYL